MVNRSALKALVYNSYDLIQCNKKTHSKDRFLELVDPDDDSSVYLLYGLASFSCVVAMITISQRCFVFRTSFTEDIDDMYLWYEY